MDGVKPTKNPAQSAGGQDDRAVYGPAGAEGDQLRRSSYGYDIRVADEFRIFTKREFDDRGPEAFHPKSDRGVPGRCLHPFRPNSLRGAYQWNISGFAERGDDLSRKSTYARCGIIVNVTPFNRVGRFCDAGNQQHDAAAGEDLCE